MKALALAALLLLSACSRAADVAPTTAATSPANRGPADPALASDLVGTTPPTWTTGEWLNSPPLTQAGLRGRVVLVRWFMSPSCPMCSATAPALETLHREFGDKGLTVIGMYHHKEETPLAPGEVAGYVKTYGFDFPVAVDPDWTTLKAWWLSGHDRDYTSVSFLLDKRGQVRGIHKGGRMAPGEPDYLAMKRGIEKLLAEPI